MHSFSKAVVVILATLSSADAFVSPTYQRNAFSSLASTATDFDLNAYIVEKNGPITKALQESIVSLEPQTAKICESMLYSLMAGGKRIRPVLCLAACEMFAGSDEKAMPSAVAVEMIHTMSLIHDDLPSMDNDDLRRGKPTNHVVYGEEVAILAGDALLSDSFKFVAENTKGVDPERVLDVVVRLGKSVGPKGLAGGQAMDLECEGKPVDEVSLDDLRWIHTHKTAALLQVSVAAGAIIGGATPEEVEACEKYALNIGLAFQVADDILDITQSSEELGKTAGKDLEADKATYPRLLGLDGAREEAQRLIAESKKALEPFGDRAIPLLALADYIINRKN
uniref:Trans-prenyltransferase 5 n=1 Tax=Haslea ostrearia TaxID=67476 RepID=A0A3G5BBY1_HASOS|nr:trans-prenyltransferase 5 [Haslea ostrearia]